MKNFLSSSFKISGIVAFMIVLLVSCGKDEKDSKTTETELNGKWALRKEIFKEYEDGKEVYSDTETYSGNESYIEFKNGKVTLVDNSGEGSYSFTLPYTVSSDSKRILVTCDGQDCEIPNGELVIKKLDSKNLILYVEGREESEEGTYIYATELQFVKI